MITLKNLILNEFFPTELPKCFSTKGVLPYIDNISGWVTSVSPKCSSALKFSGFKSETARRQFSVPNFYHYFKAARFISEKSNEILNITDKQKNYSLTAPIKGTPTEEQSYKKMSFSKTQTKTQVEKKYLDNSFMLKLDISSFFDSIYTHSLPWAIHTKRIAKKERNNLDYWGNKLDVYMRSMNSDQTNGILVGNALSRIVSEIILCTVDTSIQKAFPELQYVRFVDDYYIFVKDETQIQPIIAFIRKELLEYELSLNETKIKIYKSPFFFDSPWIEELKLFLHSPAEQLLNKAINLYNEYEDVSIFRYALKAVSLQSVRSDVWERLESKIYNLWVRFPSLTELILPLLMQKESSLRKATLKNVIYTLFNKCILLNLQQELIWVIFSLKVLNIRNIKQDIALQVFESHNDLAIILILDFISSNIIAKTGAIQDKINELRNDLEEADIQENGENGALMNTSNWLLAYEAQLHKWLDTADNKFLCVNNNPFFKSMLAKKIDFYDSSFSITKASEANTKTAFTRKEVKDYLMLVKRAVENPEEIDLFETIKSTNEKFLESISETTYS